MIIINSETGKPTTPTGYKVAPTSYKKLETLSQELLPILPKVPGNPYQIDAAAVLEFFLPQAGYKYAITEVDKLKDTVAFTIPERNLIVIRSDVYDALDQNQPFASSTIVHELSHIDLEHAKTFCRDAKLGAHKFYEDSEWQAKAYTAALMMPIEACLKVNSIAELSEMCGTSMQAAEYRLKRLVKDGILKNMPSRLI